MLLKKQEVRWNTAKTFTSPVTPITAGGILPPRMILKALAPGLPLQLGISAFFYQWNMLLPWVLKMKPHKYWSIAKFSKQQKYWFKSRFIMLLVNKIKLLQFKPSLALLIFLPSHEILAVTERNEGTQAFASIKESLDVPFQFAEKKHNWPHAGTSQVMCARKKSWNKAPKRSQLQGAKQGSLSNHTAHLGCLRKSCNKSRQKYKTTLNLIPPLQTGVQTAL